jgi:hypothetical protein
MTFGGVNMEKMEYNQAKPEKNCMPANDGPVSHGWMPLGVGRGIKWTLWPTNVVLSRQEKQGDRWLTTEELHLAPTILKELHWRMAHWLASIEKNGTKKEDA